MADAVLHTLKDSTTACNIQQQQPNYNSHDDDNVFNYYEQPLLMNGQCAGYSTFVSSDVENKDLLGRPTHGGYPGQ